MAGSGDGEIRLRVELEDSLIDGIIDYGKEEGIGGDRYMKRAGEVKVKHVSKCFKLPNISVQPVERINVVGLLLPALPFLARLCLPPRDAIRYYCIHCGHEIAEIGAVPAHCEHALDRLAMERVISAVTSMPDGAIIGDLCLGKA